MEYTMLIVDDNCMNREILSLLFNKKFDIIECESANEALDILKKCSGNVDIILLDLIMPEMSGFDFLKQRNNISNIKNIPVVVITSSNAFDDQVEAFKLGADDFINKPFIKEIIIKRVNNVISSTKRLRHLENENEKFRIKSEIDEMTGLYNKATTQKMITSILKDEYTRTHALLVIDIDNFKAVNDIHGHLVGDHTIKIVANVIANQFRQCDIVGRIGGDEFAVLMINVPSLYIVRSKVNEIIQILKYKPNVTAPANVSLSIGFSLNENVPMSYEQLFVRSDKALYQAKIFGKARSQEYGVDPVISSNCDEESLIVIGRNRNVCSVIDSQMSSDYNIIQIGSLNDLPDINDKLIKKIVFACIDVSDFDNDTLSYWQNIMNVPLFKNIPVLAICKEGNLTQYRDALSTNVTDILSSPLSPEKFRRRLECHLKLNIKDEDLVIKKDY